ncbi:MAG TPA: MCP four helix bundle domain-containing protein [Chlorobaculum sp.]|nr:MCP four helix bundle domain-containing protein [Chlorobaculum sp.]
MEGGKRAAGRRITIIWTASLVATALITLLASSYYHRTLRLDANSLSLEKQALLADMRINLARSVEKEKSAVIAADDEQSRNFAEQSKSSSAQVDRDLKNLDRLIAQGGSEKERDLLKKFEASWSNVQQIDAGLLESAMQNTNVKAVDLSSTIGAELLRKIDENLAKLAARSTPPSRKPLVEKLAAGVGIATRNIAILQSRHINASAEADKKGIEASIQAENLKTGSTLKSLERMVGDKKSRTYVKEASADFGEFMRVNDEIVRLSHLNTNRNTVDLSLGKKRVAETECDRTLKSLQSLASGDSSGTR